MKKTVLFIIFLGCMISEAETKTIENKEVNDPTSIIISPYNNSKITNSKFSNIFGASDTITNSEYSNIFGILNKINNSKQTSIIGEINKIENSEYTKLLGNNNIINSSKYSYIFGTNIQAESSEHANILGRNIIIKDSINSNIIGEKNTIINSKQTITIGELNEVVKSENTKVLGNKNKINNSNYSYIFGANINAENSNFGIAIGASANLINAVNSVAIGAGSKATFSDSVALGSFSETKLSEKSAYLTDQKNVPHYVVSVGGRKIKRRIQGLADGAEDDEAVTVAQLKKLKSEVKGSTEKSDLALSGVANAIAMANLVQVNSYSDYRHNLSAAYGYYCGTQAVALGFSGVTKDRRLVYKLSGSVNNKGNLALGVGAGVMLGNKEESLEHKDINVKELYERITKLEKENSAIKQRMIEQDTIIQKLESIIRK
ncbi:YadA-like family protein [uncultured Sneathia sp.]|uniref:YadA family autotransporter adhesin n=1 Tax=uncultured Sneathia sp. TaxID=278067 RepID=UPI00259769E5|nr:YadA-like family protein [uncultured Sneathia sp.]